MPATASICVEEPSEQVLLWTVRHGAGHAPGSAVHLDGDQHFEEQHLRKTVYLEADRQQDYDHLESELRKAVQLGRPGDSIWKRSADIGADSWTYSRQVRDLHWAGPVEIQRVCKAEQGKWFIGDLVFDLPHSADQIDWAVLYQSSGQTGQNF